MYIAYIQTYFLTTPFLPPWCTLLPSQSKPSGSSGPSTPTSSSPVPLSAAVSPVKPLFSPTHPLTTPPPSSPSTTSTAALGSKIGGTLLRLKATGFGWGRGSMLAVLVLAQLARLNTLRILPYQGFIWGGGGINCSPLKSSFPIGILKFSLSNAVTG